MPTTRRTLTDWPRLDVRRMLAWSDEGGYTDVEWKLDVEWRRDGTELELRVARGGAEFDGVLQVRGRNTRWSSACPRCQIWKWVLYIDDDLNIRCVRCLAPPNPLQITVAERRLVEHIKRGYLQPVLENLQAGKSKALIAMRAMEHAGLSPRRMTVAPEAMRRRRERRAELERRKWQAREADCKDI